MDGRMLLDKLTYLELKIPSDSIFNHENERYNLFYPSYKVIFDFLHKVEPKKFLLSNQRIGFRFNADNVFYHKLELFLFSNSDLNNSIFDQDTILNLQVLHKDIIKIKLVQEGLIRNTLIPFNPKRNNLYQGMIYNIPDYAENQDLNGATFTPGIRPFSKISSKMELIKHRNLYRPLDIEKLPNKINFEEFEVIYVHNWDSL